MGSAEGVEKGYVKLFRKSLECEIWGDEGLWYLWSYCLIKAAWKPKDVTLPRTKTIVHIDRGQFLTGRHALWVALYGKATCTDNLPSEVTVMRRLFALAQKKMLIIQSDRLYSLVTVSNYEYYADELFKRDQALDQVQNPNHVSHFDHKQEYSLLHENPCIKRVIEEERVLLCDQPPDQPPGKGAAQSKLTDESKFTADAAALLGRTDLPPGLLRFFDHCRKINRNLQPWFCKEVEFAFTLGVTAEEAMALVDRDKCLLVDPRKLCKTLVAEREKNKTDSGGAKPVPYLRDENGELVMGKSGEPLLDMRKYR